eukprot:CAMPEP_0174265940 /NCGR_PEP_ID=MMETSP0439-20130205/28482_1 /TAXON_ID=0 /ORGANISM="Stereomyxa ramosa, Strain Chinc5" /LENGTH=395 /DNA_ID=CAMNT_0015352639 /DNA_START=180 /DNA_END=1367 /DNA_ORIENTATION=+
MDPVFTILNYKRTPLNALNPQPDNVFTGFEEELPTTVTTPTTKTHKRRGRRSKQHGGQTKKKRRSAGKKRISNTGARKDKDGKRKQVKVACYNCRRSHSGCSDDRPCRRCVAKKIECFDMPREADQPNALPEPKKITLQKDFELLLNKQHKAAKNYRRLSLQNRKKETKNYSDLPKTIKKNSIHELINHKNYDVNFDFEESEHYNTNKNNNTNKQIIIDDSDNNKNINNNSPVLGDFFNNSAGFNPSSRNNFHYNNLFANNIFGRRFGGYENYERDNQQGAYVSDNFYNITTSRKRKREELDTIELETKRRKDHHDVLMQAALNHYLSMQSGATKEIVRDGLEALFRSSSKDISFLFEYDDFVKQEKRFQDLVNTSAQRYDCQVLTREATRTRSL